MFDGPRRSRGHSRQPSSISYVSQANNINNLASPVSAPRSPQNHTPNRSPIMRRGHNRDMSNQTALPGNYMSEVNNARLSLIKELPEEKEDDDNRKNSGDDDGPMDPIQVIARLEREEKLTSALKMALRSRNPRMLAVHIGEAEDLGITSQAVAESKRLLPSLELEFACLSELRDAMRVKDPQALKTALDQAKELGLSGKTIDNARKLYIEIAPPLSASETSSPEGKVLAQPQSGSRASSQEGKVSAHQDNIKEQLSEGVESRDIDKLERALQIADKVKLRYAGIPDARELLKRLKFESSISLDLKKATVTRNLSLLSEVCERAHQADFSNDEVLKAEALLRDLEHRDKNIDSATDQASPRQKNSIAEASSSPQAEQQQHEHKKQLSESQSQISPTKERTPPRFGNSSSMPATAEEAMRVLENSGMGMSDADNADGKSGQSS
uniref:Uncharacterized protein n=1 Tax=Lotharella globosa TaxID=91324 RepID=A0A7S3ZHA0_9EUKA